MYSRFLQAHTRNKIAHLMIRDQYFIEYTAQKEQPDFVPHSFHWHMYWNNMLRQQLTEFNHAYRGMNVQRVRMHIMLSLKDFQIKDKHSTFVTCDLCHF
jgi:hypothetical protein